MQKRLLFAVLAAGLVLSLAGCPEECKGELDCVCNDDNSCNNELMCIEERCQEPTCTVGDMDCACFGNGTCGATASGVQLICTAGLCDLPSCVAGEAACSCGDGDSCDPGLECNTATNRCELPGCPPGERGCTCRTDLSCNPNLLCDEGVCLPYDCTPGTVGCQCDDGGCQGGELYCDGQDTCQIDGCPAGQEGCGCVDSECGHNSRGEALSCEAGVCTAPSCTPGVTGCVCAGGTDCGVEADICRDGFCRSEFCVPGEINCTCINEGCAPGLTCRNGSICIDGTGYVNGPCHPNSTCERGNRCTENTCVQCLLGSTGCACNDAGGCNPGLECVVGHCVIEGSMGPAVPLAPKCYTPCEDDLVEEDGTFRRCSAEGLMDGCAGERACTEGCCTLDGELPTACTDDLGCPAHQLCIEGQCYSNCQINEDCHEGFSCYMQVCRPTCDTEGNTCPDGSFCETHDGEFGNCMPMSEPNGEDQFEVDGEYELSMTAIPFSNVNTGVTITLTNNSPRFETFTIRKLEHTALFADNTSETLPVDANPATLANCDPAVDCPLWWIEMGEEGAAGRVQEFEIGVDGNGTSVDIDIQGAGSFEAVRWMGRFEVSSPRLPTKHISAEYSERPDGRWAGNIYYFAQFGDKELAAWAATNESRSSTTLQERVGNAFIQKWGAFRNGRLPWEEFEAVLVATRDDTWRWPSVRADCPVDPDGACYMSGASASGLVTYSTSLSARPIPTGVVELPFAVNMYQPDPDNAPGIMQGRIESRLALQYAGNPAFYLDFGSDPSECESTSGNTCQVYIDNLDTEDNRIPLASINIGGRYITDTGGCDQEGYILRKEPWLVPGFTRATALDLTDQILKREECRDTVLPFENGGAELTEVMLWDNKSLAASNPIPDGRTRKRSLMLVDGALINTSTLFILFEESFESFLPDDTETFSAYGYMVLYRQAADLDMKDENADEVPDVYEGAEAEETRTDQPGRLDVACSEAMLNEALDYSAANDTVSSANVHELVVALLTGEKASANREKILMGDADEAVHYLCVDTRMFNGGRYDVPDTSMTIDNTDLCGFATVAENNYDDNGFCDDGGAGSDTAICPFGTDYTDCAAMKCPGGSPADCIGDRTPGDVNERTECPAESEVIYFTVVPGELGVAAIAHQSCQTPADGEDKGSCDEDMIDTWKTDGKVVQKDPHWECSSYRNIYCDNNRQNLREGKTFYKQAYGNDTPPFTNIYADINTAFRYKTRFRSRTGKTLGFAPQLCLGSSDQVPYCYDPPVVERVRERVDCLLSIWRDYYDHADAPLDALHELKEEDDSVVPAIPAVTTTSKKMLDDFLCSNYAYTESCHPGMDESIKHDGFERLYTELLVMMGDESYTQAFASRFDLAGTNARSFQGTEFEDDGKNLSGPAGFELFTLYQAAQYYQEALDRFYGMSPLVWKSLGYDTEERNFVTQSTVTYYLERVIRASTQKARTWSQIAQRYQNINEPGLARRVVERAYTSTYLESIVLARLMTAITDALAPDDKPAVFMEIEKAQRRYRMALLDMRNVYKSITEDINFFGFPPDYIPFPTLSASIENSAFEVIMGRAKSKVAIAKERENDALNRNRAFETDAEEFQAELVRLRTNYENQLGDVCGTFVGADGRVYPAIATYADLNEHARRVGDPCGRVGAGSITSSISQFEMAEVDLRRIRTSFENVLAEIEIERSTAAAECGMILDTAQFVYQQGTTKRSLQAGIAASRNVISGIDRVINFTSTIAGLGKCFVIAGTANGSDCPASGLQIGIYAAVAVVGGITQTGLEVGISVMEDQMTSIDLETAKWETERQCDSVMLQANSRMARLMLRLKEISLEALRAQYSVQMTYSDIDRQFNLAKRLEQELAESQQFAINIQAARNDPNVRIYRNDAFINADLSFQDALREAYRATKVYEYYTSQSYAKLEQLFLIRMVQYGDYNLANYLAEIENEFYIFEEDYGLPDTRVAILSLRDDILNVPRVDDLGRAYTKNERIDMMRVELADPGRLDDNGYLTIGFSTNFEALSPLTRNHKILYLESEVIGSEVGDTLGRIYLRQQGTSVIDSLVNEKQYYRFPERLAVLNPFFNGTRVFDKEIYRNDRMRDRPYVNTSWELILNQRDEMVNQDMNLQSLTDVRVNIYYTDFTQF